jgi:hypothetical protein
MNKKYMGFIVLVFFVLASCQQTTRHQEEGGQDEAVPSTGAFGEQISEDEALPAAEVTGLFGEADSAVTKLTGHILASCKHSGCWMDLDIGGQEVIHVTFKDEDFTIPLDAAGKNAVIQGIAYREMIPVETLQNYAREDGKSEEEISAITEPAWKYEFVATGVIIEE